MDHLKIQQATPLNKEQLKSEIIKNFHPSYRTT